MEENNRELARRVFVLVTEILEDAFEAALVGQAPALTAKGSIKSARQIQKAAHAIANLADTAIILAHRSRNKRQ